MTTRVSRQSGQVHAWLQLAPVVEHDDGRASVSRPEEFDQLAV